jgi:hypothetical protein
VTTWLTADWFDLVLSMVGDLPERPGLNASIQCEITGGPAGDTSCSWVLAEGRPVGGGPGSIDHPDVTLTLGWADALAILRGDLDPNVAFMQGRLKVGGSMGVLLAILAAAGAPESRDLGRRIAAVTEY